MRRSSNTFEGPCRWFLDFETEIIPRSTNYKWTSCRIRNPKPSWEDLTQKRIAIPTRAFDEILRCLSTERTAILVGEKDSGKTWLCYSVGYHALECDHADVLFCQVDDEFSAHAAYGYLDEQEVFASTSEQKLLILDDCHLNPDETEEFLVRITQIDNENIHFLFSTRRIGRHILRDGKFEDTFDYIGEEKECVIDLSNRQDGGEYVRKIALKFIKTGDLSHELTSDELHHLISICGNDLYFLRLLLDSWKDSDVPILQLTKRHIYESLWAARGDIRLVDPSRRNVISTISYFSQFEPLMVSREYLEEKTDDFPTVQSVCDAGLFSMKSWQFMNFLGLPDTLSHLILEAIEFKTSNPVPRVEATVSIFREYLSRKPTNWLFVFSSLGFACKSSNRQRREIANKTIRELIEDPTTIDHLADILAHAHPHSVQYLLQILGSHGADGTVMRTVWTAFVNGSSPHQTALRLTAEARTLSSAFSFLQLTETVDYAYGEKVLEQLSRYPERLLALANKSTATIRVNFLLRFASKNTVLLHRLLGPASSLEYVRNQIRHSTATTITHTMGMVKKCNIDVGELFVDYTNQDWEKIAAKSTLNGIRLLVYRLIQYKLHNIARALCQTLSTCDLSLIVNRRDSTVYRLNGLLGNIKQVDEKVAEQFVDSLCLVPMGDLFLRQESYYEKEGYSKSSQINLFLSRTEEFKPGFTQRVVERISKEEWKRLVKEAPTKDALWLIWGIYKGSRAKCCDVLDEDLANLVMDAASREELCLRLPILGIVGLCKSRVPRVELTIKECTDTISIMVKNGQNPRLVLSMIALRMILEPQQYDKLSPMIATDFRTDLLHSEDHVERLIGRIAAQLKLF